MLTMIMVNIFEAKAKLSDLLDRAAAGERILICKRNQPIAELRPVPAHRTAPRPIGKAKGAFSIPAAFFAPLEPEEIEGFEGEATFPPVRTRSSHAAEEGPGRTRPRKAKRA
jgi:prevent-host-death family protein